MAICPKCGTVCKTKKGRARVLERGDCYFCEFGEKLHRKGRNTSRNRLILDIE